MNFKAIWSLTKQAMTAWSNDFAPSMGAALSYYTLFSIAPLLVIVIAIAGYFFGADAVRSVVFDQLHALMGEEGAEAVQDMLLRAQDTGTAGIAAIVSVAGLVVGATTVFAELQNDLDRIWRAPALKESGGIWNLIRTRLLSFGMILGLAFLLAVSLLVSAALAMIGKWWDQWLGGWEALAHVLDIVVNLGLLTVIFALIYKMIPRVEIGWRDVWFGAIATSILFTIGKVLIGLYLGKSDIASSFGTAGSLAIVMVWVYYASQIFLFGAELTRAYAETHGSRRDVADERRSARSKTGRRRSDGAMPTGAEPA